MNHADPIQRRAHLNKIRPINNATRPVFVAPKAELVKHILRMPMTSGRTTNGKHVASAATLKLTLLAIACFEGKAFKRSELAEITGQSEYTVRDACNVLAKRGLIGNERDEHHRRIARLTLETA